MKQFAGNSLVLAALLLLAGCHGDKPALQARGITGKPYQGQNDPANRPPAPTAGGPAVNANVEISQGNDLCAAQLQDIAFAMLMFRQRTGRSPDSLEALRPYALDGAVLKLECPVTKRPYLYDPNGPLVGNSVVLANSDGRTITLGQAVSLGQLLIYDAAPSHGGERWGVIIGQDAHGNSSIATPYRIPERTFQELIRSGSPPRQ